MIKEVTIQKPMKMFVSYRLKDINNRAIETYEIEVLIKKGEEMKDALKALQTSLDDFCMEAVDVIKEITRHHYAM
jgi:hypothetical protein